MDGHHQLSVASTTIGVVVVQSAAYACTECMKARADRHRTPLSGQLCPASAPTLYLPIVCFSSICMYVSGIIHARAPDGPGL